MTRPQIDVVHHFPDFLKLDTIIEMIANVTRIIEQKDFQIMATLQDLTDAVAAEKTIEDSVVALLGKLSADLQTAIGANDPAAMQAVVDAINNNAAALSAAVVANTPAAAPDPAPVADPAPAADPAAAAP